MSLELWSRPDRPSGYLPADVAQQEDLNAPAIRRQAAEIIAAVLSDSSPHQARARAELGRCVEAYPGRPEVALAAHLVARREVAAAGPLSGPLPGPAGAAGADGPTRPSATGTGAPPRRGVRQTVLHQRPTLRVYYGRPARRGSAGPTRDGD